MQFVAAVLAGEPMAVFCREFGISRKTGYKIYDRYQESGLEGLTDKNPSAIAVWQPTAFQIENYRV